MSFNKTSARETEKHSFTGNVVMTECIVFSEMHFNSLVNGGEFSGMKGTHTLNTVQRLFFFKILISCYSKDPLS